MIRVDRPGSQSSDVLARGKRSIAIDVKVFSGRELIRTLLSTADVVIDPFRPGVMERLGLGPEIFLSKKGLNQRIVYARIVGSVKKIDRIIRSNRILKVPEERHVSYGRFGRRALTKKTGPYKDMAGSIFITIWSWLF